jgi:4-diphosphocytidyl-2-C-methyl-D-erythritol kinase
MIKSYAKINLSLRVVQKLKNGFHDIQSNNLLLDLHDKIEITKTDKKKDIIIFKGPFKKMVSSYKNSIKDTILNLKKYKLISKKNYYKIIVNKKIPVFAGFGGGTSNSFFLIKYLVKKKIENKIKNIFEKKLGSDLGIFSFKQSFQKKLGCFTQYKKKYIFTFLLVYPNIKCSTKYIYSKVKNYSERSKLNNIRFNSKSYFLNEMKKDRNDLERIVLKKYKKIEQVIDLISTQKGCYFSRLTGSGSACFGIFKSRKLAYKGLKIVKNKFPKYWCVVSKTI